MSSDLNGKRALVCGSTQGIGRACAAALASRGASITLAARDEARLAEVLAALPTDRGRNHQALCADFADPDLVQARVAEHVEAAGPMHILINNTGGPPAGTAFNASPQDFAAGFTSHLFASQLLVQTLVPGMRADGYGRIINIISISAKAPIPGLGVSNTVRGAMASWAKTLATELGPDGITVNNVLPGYTATERLFALAEQQAGDLGVSVATLTQQWKDAIPLRRFADPQETAAAVAFLASPDAAYITGINLPVDGGRLPNL